MLEVGLCMAVPGRVGYMTENSGIERTDAIWNGATGRSIVSAACAESALARTAVDG